MHTTKYVCMIMRIPVFWETSCTWIIVESCVFSHYGGPVCVCVCAWYNVVIDIKYQY